MEGFGWYSYEITKRLVEHHPEHEFVFFFDRPYDSRFIFGQNVTPVVLRPPARHPILFIIWFEFALKRAMKKYQVDILFSPDGYLSLGSKVPQIGVIHDINFEYFPEDIPYSARIYLKKYFPKFARKASKIITVSNYSKVDIVEKYQIDSSKIAVIWNGASEKYQPLNEETKKEIRLRYVHGKPYFLFVGSIHPRKNVRRLIEAFAVFKNSIASDVQLVIVGAAMWKQGPDDLGITDMLRSDIHFLGHISQDELALIVGSATALTYVPYFEGFGIPLVEAMKCGTPIICGNRTSLPEVAGDAALYCDPYNVEDIANQMQNLWKSSTLQIELAQKGFDRSKLFSWDHAADQVWKEIEVFLK